MKTKKSILVLTLVVVALALAACGAKATLEGKWKPAAGQSEGFLGMEPEKMVVEFTKDGKMMITYDGKSLADYRAEQLKASGMTEEQIKAAGSAEAPEVTYKTDGDKFTMITSLAGEATSFQGTWKIEGDRLTMSSEGVDSVFNRVK